MTISETKNNFNNIELSAPASCRVKRSNSGWQGAPYKLLKTTQ